jgi:hypothetical protein
MSARSLKTERRRDPRIAFAATIICMIADQKLLCRAVDLSASGILLLPPARAAVGQLVTLMFTVPAVSAGLTVHGILVRETRADGSYAWGIQLVDVPRRAAQELRRHVHERILQTVIGQLDEPAVPELGANPLTPADLSGLGGRPRAARLDTPTGPLHRRPHAPDEARSLARVADLMNTRKQQRRRSATPPPKELASLYREALAEIGDAKGHVRPFRRLSRPK